MSVISIKLWIVEYLTNVTHESSQMILAYAKVYYWQVLSQSQAQLKKLLGIILPEAS